MGGEGEGWLKVRGDPGEEGGDGEQNEKRQDKLKFRERSKERANKKTEDSFEKISKCAKQV